jgi:hypothetical protein
MKVIFPSFAWFALAAAVACAQSDGRLPAMSILPPNATANSADNPAGSAGSTAGLPVVGTNTTNAASTTSTMGPEKTAASTDGAELFIQRVAAAANQLQSVQARIRYHANMFGSQTVGAGIYLQQRLGDQRQFRLELKTAVGQQLLTFQQVCDGKYVWQYRDSFNKPISDKTNPNNPDADSADRPTIARIDLTKVRQILQDSDRKVKIDALGQLAVGGMPKLLDGLKRSFRFNRVEAGGLDTLPVWIAAGAWLPEALAPVSKELAQQAAWDLPLDLKLLPPQLPEQVWLFVGQDDLFPYRIEFRRRGRSQGRGAGAAEAEMQTMVTVEFYEVRLNAPINPREFDYQPGNADILDTTASFLKELQGKESATSAEPRNQ